MSTIPAESNGAPQAGDPPPSQPVAQAELFVAKLARVSALRATTEVAIATQAAGDKKSAQRQYEEARQVLEDWLNVEKGSAEADYSRVKGTALARFQKESLALEQELADLQKQVTDEAVNNKRRLDVRVKELKWEAETVYDASKHVPPKQLKAFEESMEAWTAQVSAERAALDELLVRWRHKSPSDLDDPTAAPPVVPPPQTDGAQLDPSPTVANLQEQLEEFADEKARFEALRLPPIVSDLTLVWVFGAIAAGLAGLAWYLGLQIWGAGVAIAISAALGFACWRYLSKLARAHIENLLPAIEQRLNDCDALCQLAVQQGRAFAEAQARELIDKRDRGLTAAAELYKAKLGEIEQRRETRLRGPKTAFPQKMAGYTAERDRDVEAAEQEYRGRGEEIRRREVERQEIEDRYRRTLHEIKERVEAQWQKLTDDWRTFMAHQADLANEISGRDRAGQGDRWITDWLALAGGAWKPADDLPAAVRFGQYRINTDQIEHGLSQIKDLAEMTPAGYTLPALVPFPERPSLMFRTSGAMRRVVIEAMQTVMLRLLMTIPPGKIRFTIVDPVGLGENFAAFMHLADFNEALISSRIWTEPNHIEQRLVDLSEHMETVIQKYLRNEFESIQAYNRDAGEIAEPIHFLVVANFPANFSDAAQRRLLAIAASGTRCGVYTLLMADTSLPAPTGITLAELEKHTNTLVARDGNIRWKDKRYSEFDVVFDGPPSPQLVTDILQTAGRYAAEANRVEVPFDVIAPAQQDIWTSSARGGIDVPLGRVGASRLQAMQLGKGTSQHVLVSGKTGSGKSTLLHALITNIGLRYTPDEIELYLIDFKQGVEFKAYATHQMPHARVVAIESDREFGLSVLGRLDAELKFRAERFRALGVQDLAGYRDADPATPMPRILLIVDEFQEFFTIDDKVSQDASVLLDRLVRQGRAFGIHLLMGTQTLAGAYSLARSTIGQMAVRIALQCSESDAHLILSEGNSAARLLSRPGEAIYNDSNGMVEGNHPFQVVWLSDSVRESLLEDILLRAREKGMMPREQIVFEGNVPADPARNGKLSELLNGGPLPAAAPWHVWLGEAVAIKDPTAAVFRPHSGSNLLMVGQNEDAAQGILAMSVVSLIAQQVLSGTEGAKIYIFDSAAGEIGQGVALSKLMGESSEPGRGDAIRLFELRDLPAGVNELAQELQRRQQAAGATYPPIFVLVYGVHKMRPLRKAEDDYGFSRADDDAPPDPAKQFTTLLREGPAAFMHTIAWCDSLNNLHRTWDRQNLREFEMRIAFQMSENDSSSLIDSPLASKLGPFRGLFHSEEQGLLEKFRPYRWPNKQWLDEVRRLIFSTSSPSQPV